MLVAGCAERSHGWDAKKGINKDFPVKKNVKE